MLLSLKRILVLIYIKNNMAKSQVQFTKDNEYYIPKTFVDRFGKFDYDPATTKEKAKEFGISNFDTIETDGLTKDWTQYKRIWINPPFTRKHEFIIKAWETYQKVKNEIYILFPIEFLTTARFHNAVGGGGNCSFRTVGLVLKVVLVKRGNLQLSEVW